MKLLFLGSVQLSTAVPLNRDILSSLQALHLERGLPGTHVEPSHQNKNRQHMPDELNGRASKNTQGASAEMAKYAAFCHQTRHTAHSIVGTALFACETYKPLQEQEHNSTIQSTQVNKQSKHHQKG